MSSSGVAAAAKAFGWLPGLKSHRRHRQARLPMSPLPIITAGGDRRASGFLEVFRRFDADGDGKVSGAEVLSFLTSAGEKVSPEDVEKVVGELDSDGDGLMDYGDFVKLMAGGDRGGSAGEGDEDLRTAFQMFALQENGTGGCITPAGLRRALGRLGEEPSPEQCAAMIRAFDADGNGVLDYEEFYRMMT